MIPRFVKPPNGYPWSVLPPDPQGEGWLTDLLELRAKLGLGEKRGNLVDRFAEFHDWLVKSGFHGLILIGGSFVENKRDPCDVDASVFLRDPPFSQAAESVANEYRRGPLGGFGVDATVWTPKVLFDLAWTERLTRPTNETRGTWVHYMDVFGPYVYRNFDPNADRIVFERLQERRKAHAESRPRLPSGIADESGVKCQRGFLRIEFGK